MPDYGQADEGIGQIVLSPGETGSFPFSFQYTGVVTDQDVELMQNRRKVIFIVCRIRYEDIFGIERLRGTAVFYDHLSKAYVTVGGRDFNYDRVADRKDAETIPYPLGAAT
jgi:hypothetical protein